MGTSTSSSKKKKTDTRVKDTEEVKDKDKKYTPEALRKEITSYQTAKSVVEPLLLENIGLKALLNDERERLLSLLAVHEQLKKDRDVLLNTCCELDAAQIRCAFTKNNMTVDKTELVNIMACRTNWQLQKISEIYEKNYSLSLMQQLVNHLTTLIGGMFTGSVTELCNLLTYRLLLQGERDAAFLRDCTDGYLYLDDDSFIEIVSTRSNEQLRDAVDEFFEVC
jgi:hypothetical protein